MKSKANSPIFFSLDPMIFEGGWRNITRPSPSNGLAFIENLPDA